MTSKERMLAALEYKETDYVPCSFMIFFNMFDRSKSEAEFVEKQLELGLDAYAHVGHLKHSFHPDVKYSEWVEEEKSEKFFCRKIDTPKGPLTQRIRQSNNWPHEGNFPIFNDWLITRAKEVLVKPEEDLEKLKYFFGSFKDEDINKLRETAAEAKNLADKHGILQLGGWKPSIDIGMVPETRGNSDGGVVGGDCMAWLSGYEDVMILSLTQPEIIKEYANIIAEWNSKQIEVYLDVTDADIIWKRAWYETTEFWTPEAYKNIIAPVIKKEAEIIHQAGKKFGYILTSAFLPVIDDLLGAGIDVLVGLDPEEGKGTDFGIVKEKFTAQKAAIWGGVSGAMTIEQGTAKETEDAVGEAFETLAKDGGFILSPVDNIRDDTQQAWDNTQVFIDAWKKHRNNKY